MSAAVSNRPRLVAVPPGASVQRAKLTPEQQARATLLGAVELASQREAECLDASLELGEMALELALLAQTKAEEARRWREAAIRYACEYAGRVDGKTDETCMCASCLAEVM